MKRFEIVENESIITLICQKKYLNSAKEEIKKQRTHILNYIEEHREFKTSLLPFKANNNATRIINKMINASIKYNVGPMASVAGAIAEMTVLRLIDEGANEVILDNGGDMALFLKKPTNIGLYTGNSNIQGYGFYINTTGKLIGICTSSGKIGHSKSFGISYTTTVFSDSPTDADAAATRIGNDIKYDDSERLSVVLEHGKNYDNVSGIVAVTKNHIGSIGNIPKLIKTKNCFSKITRG